MTSLIHRFNINYFFKVPTSSKLAYFWLIVFLAFLIVDSVIYILYKRKSRKEKPYKKYCLKMVITTIPSSAMGLIFVIARYEHLAPFSYRFWLYLMLVCLIGSEAWLYLERGELKEELIRFRSNERKKKWLKNPKAIK
jgi:cbb3-type cytochrome oxidase subunit 3